MLRSSTKTIADRLRRRKSVGAIISETVLHQNRTTPKMKISFPDSDNLRNHGVDSGHMHSMSKLDWSSFNSFFERRPTAINCSPSFPHLPCDPELARWFSVMPPMVINKMFEYMTTLATLRRCESLDSSACKPRPTTSRADLRSEFAEDNDDVKKDLAESTEDGNPMSTPSLLDARILNQSTSNSLKFESFLQNSSRQNMLVLQRLRKDYKEATSISHVLAAAIQKAESQEMGREEPLFASPRSFLNQSPVDAMHSKLAFNPPPESQNFDETVSAPTETLTPGQTQISSTQNKQQRVASNLKARHSSRFDVDCEEALKEAFESFIEVGDNGGTSGR